MSLLFRITSFHLSSLLLFSFFFFFNDTATTEIYTLSLHDALPISTTSHASAMRWMQAMSMPRARRWLTGSRSMPARCRSEEHTSELQSRSDLVCRLLLEKKKKRKNDHIEATSKALSDMYRATVK